jgi:hypothetical protein
MMEVPAIGKNQRNQTQGFMYRGIDVVMNVLQPLLSKHKVFAVPEIIDQRREERTTKSGNNLIYSICTIKYTFYADDGSSVSAVVIGEGMDSGDKATNKAMAIAFKYACFQVFCIPTEEMKDPDAETPEPSLPRQQHNEPPKPPANMQCIDDITCEKCKKVIAPYTDDNGKRVGINKLISASKEKFGGVYCVKCAQEMTNA